MDTLTMEEVVVSTFNEDSFPLATKIPLEKIKLINPKKTDRLREAVRTKKIKLFILDGCLEIETILKAVKAVKFVRKELMLNITICIVYQDELLIEGTIWEQKPESTQKYLIAA